MLRVQGVGCRIVRDSGFMVEIDVQVGGLEAVGLRVAG
jgi:hypothetical protein